MANKSPINLDNLSVPELTALISSAEEKRREKLADAKRDLLAEMEEKAAALGLSLEGLVQSETPARGSRKARRATAGAAAAKYRGPNGEEWSGRGRPPAWIVMAEADGKNRESFRI